ncbi:GNAT family N-acetyltransferase [Myroides sp. LJL116]
MENLQLSTPNETDFKDLYRIFQEPKNTKYIPQDLGKLTLEQIKQSFSPNQDKTLYVLKNKQGNCVGQAGIYTYPHMEDTLELGYIIDYPYHNKGLGSLLLQQLIKKVFSTTSAKKIICRMYDTNIGSARICIKNGMQLIATDILQDGKTRLTYLISSES